MRKSSIGTILVTLLGTPGPGNHHLAALSGFVVEEGPTDVKFQSIFRVACFLYDASFQFLLSHSPAPVSQGTESIVGNVGITVIRVVNPADNYVGKAAKYTVLDAGDQYLLVDVKVRCVSADESCRLSEFDFGVESNAGRDYPAELSGNFSDDIKGMFEGGEIEPGKSMSGSIIFVIKRGESGLIMVYPRLFGFGGSAKLILSR